LLFTQNIYSLNDKSNGGGFFFSASPSRHPPVVKISGQPQAAPSTGLNEGGFFTPSFKFAQSPPPPSAPQFNVPQKSPAHNHQHNHQHKDLFVFEEAVASAGQTVQIFNEKETIVGNPAFPTGPQTISCPNGVRIRKEFRDMSMEEWNRYKAAVRRMYEPDPSGLSLQDRFTKIHLDNASIAHNTAHFLPWHRWFTFLYEEELRKIDPQVTIPYWDWTFDSQRPLRSPLFLPDYLGIKTGKAGDCDWVVSFPRKHCLVRNYNPRNERAFGTFYGRRTVDRLITDTKLTWSEFATLFETSPHGIVHFKVGGPGGDLSDMASPNDPLFFLHHSMVDYVWMQRQQYTGHNGAFGGRHRGRRATASDELRPFRVTVEETFDYQRLCYDYQPFSGWLRAAPAALRAGANVDSAGREYFEHRLPDTLGDNWIAMHGWDRKWVVEIEEKLHQLESTPLGQLVSVGGSSSDTENGASNSAKSFYPALMIGAGLVAGVMVSFAL
jgi:tyrosinase